MTKKKNTSSRRGLRSGDIAAEKKKQKKEDKGKLATQGKGPLLIDVVGMVPQKHRKRKGFRNIHNIDGVKSQRKRYQGLVEDILHFKRRDSELRPKRSSDPPQDTSTVQFQE